MLGQLGKRALKGTLNLFANAASATANALASDGDPLKAKKKVIKKDMDVFAHSPLRFHSRDFMRQKMRRIKSREWNRICRVRLLFCQVVAVLSAKLLFYCCCVQ